MLSFLLDTIVIKEKGSVKMSKNHIDFETEVFISDKLTKMVENRFGPRFKDKIVEDIKVLVDYVNVEFMDNGFGKRGFNKFRFLANETAAQTSFASLSEKLVVVDPVSSFLEIYPGESGEKGYDLLFKAIKGDFIHELGHVLHSDFYYFSATSYYAKESLRDLLKYEGQAPSYEFAKAYAIYESAVYLPMILNILEDVYIEGLMSRDGMFDDESSLFSRFVYEHHSKARDDAYSTLNNDLSNIYKTWNSLALGDLFLAVRCNRDYTVKSAQRMGIVMNEEFNTMSDTLSLVKYIFSSARKANSSRATHAYAKDTHMTIANMRYKEIIFEGDYVRLHTEFFEDRKRFEELMKLLLEMLSELDIQTSGMSDPNQECPNSKPGDVSDDESCQNPSSGSGSEKGQATLSTPGEDAGKLNESGDRGDEESESSKLDDEDLKSGDEGDEVGGSDSGDSADESENGNKVSEKSNSDKLSEGTLEGHVSVEVNPYRSIKRNIKKLMNQSGLKRVDKLNDGNISSRYINRARYDSRVFTKTRSVVKKSPEFFILIDSSGSMDGNMSAVNEMIYNLVSSLYSIRVKSTVSHFSHRYFRTYSHSKDKKNFKEILKHGANGGTSLNPAIKNLLDDVRDSKTTSVPHIIIITDGDNSGDDSGTNKLINEIRKIGAKEHFFLIDDFSLESVLENTTRIEGRDSASLEKTLLSYINKVTRNK